MLKDGGGRKDKLRSMAGAVNFVWNYSNEFIRHRWKTSRFYSNKSDLHAVTKGASKELPLHSQSIQAVYEEILLRTKKEKKPIRFRTSKRNKNLGWIPFKASGVKFHGGYITYDGVRFPLWRHRKMPDGAVIKSGSFGEDSRGRWYVSIVIEIPDSEYIRATAPSGSDVGIDPGLKTIMTTSNGEKFERDNLVRVYEEELGSAQRRHKKRLAKKIHAKIKNRRLDFNHKATEKLASKYETLYFGDAASAKLKKTRMAKSVSDAGWAQIKTFLSYKTREKARKNA